MSDCVKGFNHDYFPSLLVVVDGKAVSAFHLRQQAFCCLTQPACAGWSAPSATSGGGGVVSGRVAARSDTLGWFLF